MLDLFIILIIFGISIISILKIRNEDVSHDLKIILISVVITIALVISGTVFWRNKPVQKPSQNTKEENIPTNEFQSQSVNQNSPSTQIPYTPTQPNYSVPSMVNEPIRDITPSQTELLRGVLPSVVKIETPRGSGSGFFINDNEVITNHHVLCNCPSGNIRTNSGELYPILQILAENVEADLILVRVAVPSSGIKPLRLRTTIPEVGENILAIGSPLGLQNTVTNGIVSAIRNDGAINLIQVSAAISFGSSGGPVIDMKGEVIGVATKGYVKLQNLNFCVASQHVAALSSIGGYSFAQVASCRSGSTIKKQAKDVYCYLDSDGTVKFVDWPTSTIISRSDGSLDRVAYERWVFEKIGSNPALINPEKVTEDYIARHRKKIFEQSFPYKVYGHSSMTLEEQQFYYNKLNMIRTEIYNRVVADRNERIKQYRYMMQAFDVFARQQGS